MNDILQLQHTWSSSCAPLTAVPMATGAPTPKPKLVNLAVHPCALCCGPVNVHQCITLSNMQEKESQDPQLWPGRRRQLYFREINWKGPAARFHMRPSLCSICSDYP